MVSGGRGRELYAGEQGGKGAFFRAVVVALAGSQVSILSGLILTTAEVLRPGEPKRAKVVKVSSD